MKSRFPVGYCPQREKVLDLSRSVLSGNRHYARNRRHYGRYKAKVNRQRSRRQLARSASWSCWCNGDADIDCRRCYSDDMPTMTETHAGGGLPTEMGAWDYYAGFADDLAQLFRWYLDRTRGMNHYEAESFLRGMLLCSPFGHSVKTRHAFDHLYDEIRLYRRHNYTARPWVDDERAVALSGSEAA